MALSCVHLSIQVTFDLCHGYQPESTSCTDARWSPVDRDIDFKFFHLRGIVLPFFKVFPPVFSSITKYVRHIIMICVS